MSSDCYSCGVVLACYSCGSIDCTLNESEEKEIGELKSKLDAKDELLRELVKQLNKDVGDMNCIELNRWYAENDKLLNKPEIKKLRGSDE